MAAAPGGNDGGFRIVNAVLALLETADLRRTLEASPLARSRAGARHLMKHPAVADVANDPRLLAIVSGFLGPSAVVPGDGLRRVLRAELARALASGHRIAVAGTAVTCLGGVHDR